MSEPIQQQEFPQQAAPQEQLAPPAPKLGNGAAVASLIFGIIGGVPLGLAFGVAGLIRSKKANKGKALSFVGIILSILWLVPIVYLSVHVAKASDPGCVTAKAVVFAADATAKSHANADAATLKADLLDTVSKLNAAAAQSKDAQARTAIGKLATDYRDILTALDEGKVPPADIEARINTDAGAIDSACGTLGS